MIESVAFIGLGEAGGLLAGGLLEAGAGPIAAYDILIDDPATAADFTARAGEIGVDARASSAEAVAGADLVLSAVVASQTVIAAETAAPHLGEGQYYLDINSTSPMEKRTAAAAVEAGGAHYVEAAVMDLVPPHGIRVPMLLAGAAAALLAPRLNALGMQSEAIGTEIGQASSIKMIRSVFLKGFTSILLESLMAANRVGVEDRVLDSLASTFPELDWPKLANYYMGRLTLHAGRQSSEMKAVAATLEDLGVAPLMASAAGRRLGDLAGLGLKEHFAARPPEDLEEFFQALRAAEEAGEKN
jgi:3-hydroxyisobutyrate dehydrogenase-like beta-hydroxyacid dehydrogenase